MKNILLFITILISHASFSQQILKYVDSLKHLIKRDFPQGEDEKAIKRQIKYIKACDGLGDYYNALHKEKTAIYYYELVAQLDGHTLSDDQMSLRDKICLKIGDIYFNGRGIKKDLRASIEYHAKGLIGDKGSLKNYYSKLYFNNVDPFFIIAASGSMDTLKFAVNVLNVGKQITSVKLKAYLQPIIKKLNSDTTLNCLLSINLGALTLSEESQGLAAISLSAIRNYFKKEVIAQQRLDSNVEISQETCKYKSYDLPCLQIIISKGK